MYRKMLSALALLAMVFTVTAQDYMFPSSNPPANLKPADVEQYVCLMWDDVAYSGLKGTPYETATNQAWNEISRVEGDTYQFKTWHSKKNEFGLKEGDIGASWAVRNVLPAGNNPDGSQRTMSFYVITGQMAPVTWKVGWVENPQPGDVWGWKEQTFTTVNWADPTTTVLAPVCWGREYEVFTNGGSEKEEEPHTVRMYTEIISTGFELGCHTIDHMESNSGLPQSFWPNSGEGFDPGVGAEVDLYGKKVPEQYAAWDVIGWDAFAGCKVSKECWKGALQLAEAELTEYLSVSVSGGDIFGFRAPRLEINSNGLFALKELGYTYDCSVEEGFEENMDGTNAYWPYTYDNGSPSHWVLKDGGGIIPFEQYPAGFWEVPVGVFVVPENIREEVWNHGNAINKNAPDAGEWETLESWKKHGRITAFDFNMFILWGMTKDHWVATLKHNLDLRMQNNKAPFCMGLHPDYFTPMYDYGTLLSDYNRSSYGMVVDSGWNTWDTRKEGLLEFVQYAQTKGVNFIGANELIKKMRQLQAQDNPGKEFVYTGAKWEFFKTGTSTTNTQSFTGNITNANVTVAAGEVYCGYDVFEGVARYGGLTHISLTYNTSAPLKLILLMNGDKPWEVLLNNVNNEINSGKIPLSAFHYNPYDVGTQNEVNTGKIEGIAIKIAIPNLGNQQSVTLNVKDVKLYGANPTGIISTVQNFMMGSVSLKEISKNNLKLKVGDEGRYTVNILSANGRIIQSFKNMNLSAGTNSFMLNNLSNGIYMITVSGKKIQGTLKAIIM
ncbi:hypothetical protein ACFL5S_01905 [Fibrobacterota bacterium]